MTVPPAAPDRFSRAFVLGAGSVRAFSFSAGALSALAGRGWPLTDGDLVVGTSAGALLAAAVRSGVDLGLFAGVAAAGTADSHPVTAALLDLGRLVDELSPLGWLRALRDGTAADPRLAVTAALGEMVWPAHTRIVAAALPLLTRKVFDATSAIPFSDAVAASLAVPGVFAPVRSADTRLVDGGLLSRTNADVVAAAETELLVVVSLTGLSDTSGLAAHRRAWAKVLSVALASSCRPRRVLLVQPDSALRAALAACSSSADTAVVAWHAGFRAALAAQCRPLPRLADLPCLPPQLIGLPDPPRLSGGVTAPSGQVDAAQRT